MKLTEKHLDVIARAAASAALEYMEKEKKDQEKKKYDRRLRNIKLLLRNYRSFVKHCKDIRLEINDLNEELEIEYLDSDEFKIEAIKRSKERTLAMVRYIQKTLAVFEIMCQEESAEAVRRFEVIRDLYIIEPKKSIQEIADVHFLSDKTIRRDRDKAVETLSILMFGVDAVRFK